MVNIEKIYISTSEAAKYLGVSRVTVFKKIQKGEIPAKKVGRNYVILRESIIGGISKPLTPDAKHQIDGAIERTVREYGETLRLLGNE